MDIFGYVQFLKMKNRIEKKKKKIFFPTRVGMFLTCLVFLWRDFM
uniref:Uncharacterized protein n=1 Tax=viral metagenome TaxID=1070528 RepID=A0A6C0CPX0_9ZZZZ